jgi:hypothetical protein
MLQEHGENLKGLQLKPDLCSIFEEFSGPQVKREAAKAHDVRGGRAWHGGTPIGR